MPVLTVRNLPEETHRALRVRAARNGRSTEAEIRAILDDAVRPAERLRVGTELAKLGRKFGGIELRVERTSEPIQGANFE